MATPTVFISYSHQDEAWNKRLLPQLRALENAGVGMQVWHDRKIDGGDKWYPEIQDAMANAAVAILMISSDFLASPFCVKEEVPALLKRQEEAGMLLIPVLLRPCVWKAHRWLKDRQMLPRDGKCVVVDFVGDQADVVFAAVAEQVLAYFENRVLQPAVPAFAPALEQERARMQAPAPVQVPAVPSGVARDLALTWSTSAVPWPELPVGRVDLTRLPDTGSALYGRDDEMNLLDEAWASSSQSNATPVRVLAFTANGGVGKSTLINHWLADMARQNYRGATDVFGWSFYNQGVREETVASADAFIDAALRFLGDADASAGSAWDKGARLARLIGARRALLALDGLEPLQSTQPFERGKLRDPAIESLLRGLARQSVGLCLITTREKIIDLAARPGVVMHDLEQINPKAGRALLRTSRVVGTDAELESLAARFGPHALAIALLGVYLREQPGQGISPAQALAQLPGNKPIDRVLAGFEQWLGDGAAREALHLVAFFDRPADEGCLRALRSAPVIPGLTDHLAGLNDAEWDRVLDRLAKLRLVQVQQGKSGKRFVDAHPFVRDHFAALLKGGEAWREGHRRLYQYLCVSTPDKPNATLEDLQPLYQAVAHGCQAGLQQEACDRVYLARIRRARHFYSTRKLGAFGSDLGAIAEFFEVRWSRVSPSLIAPAQAMLLDVAAYCLRAMGQLTEAVTPSRLSLAMAVRAERWEQAAVGFGTLSELELVLGDIAAALNDAKQSVYHSDQCRVIFQRIVNRAAFADALHQAGHLVEAEVHFRKAELMQAERQPTHPLLYSMAGFRYCDFILSDIERGAWQLILKIDSDSNGPQCRAKIVSFLELCRRVTERAEKSEQIVSNGSGDLLDIALSRLTQGRTALYQAILQGTAIPELQSSISAAMSDLRLAGDSIFLPRGLLTRAILRSLAGVRTGPDSAQSDLDEAWEIAERGPMPLFMADIHLYRARLFFGVAPYPWNQHADGAARGPKDDLADARRLIEIHGYGRRTEELGDAEAAAKHW